MADEANPIPPVTRNDPAAHSGDVVAENIGALKALFPAIVTDGKVDFDVLRQLLGDAVDDGAERYGLNWKGKAKARAFALTPSLGTLRPAKEDSVDWDTTQNIVIEGDNLEVLKLLRKSYAGKIKLIYIDPPYNTGKDFVYPDNYTDSLANYEALTGQRGEDGARLTSNKEASGRFHTDWLNMMYPRLMLAKELLSTQGAIFISLNDSEIASTRRLLDEIFGEENFVANIVWEKVHTRKNSSKFFSVSHDYILCVAKSKTSWPRPLLRRDDTSAYSNPDNHPKGPWKLDPITAHNPYSAEYTLTKPDGSILRRPQGGYWRFSEQTIQEKIDDDALVWGKGSSYPMIKRFLSEVQDGLVPVTLFTRVFAGDSAVAKGEVDSLFGVDAVFDYPKPTRLIERFLQIASKDEDVVVDFFAGSGTTGHAVMAQNSADGGARRFILVQLPEPLDPAKAEQKTASDFCDELGKPRTIAELTKERLRRAGDKVKADNPSAQIDTGFRVYKLASSNLKPWQPGEDLAADLLDATGNVLPGRSEDDLLVELLLKTGIDLAIPSQTRTIAGRAAHLFGGGALVVCLADIPASETRALGDGIADWLAEVSPPDKTTFFFKDSGFDAGGSRAAEARANLAATLRQRLGDEAIERLGAI